MIAQSHPESINNASSNGKASSNGATTSSAADIADFLRTLYGDNAPGYLSLFTLPGSKTEWVPADRIEDAAKIASDKARHLNVYLNIGLRPDNLGSGKRGESSSVIAIPGFWADIDIVGPAHKADNLPPTEADARALAAEMGVKPTLLVHSGHGLQGWWLFRELWVFESDEERKRAEDLALRFQSTLQIKAAAHGWTVDSVADFARVLRIPGTFNRKTGLPPVPVRLIEADESARYDPSDLEPFLLETPAPSTPTTSTTPAHGSTPTKDLGKRALKFFLLGAPIGKQREEAVAAARNCCSAGYTVEEAAELIFRGLQASKVDPDREPWTEADALSIADDLFNKPPSRKLPPLKTKAQTVQELRDKSKLDTTEDKRPPIDASEEDLPVITGEAWQAIDDANDPPYLFRQSGRLVRLNEEDHNIPTIEDVTPDRMRHELARAARFIALEEVDIKGSERKGWEEKVVIPPMSVVTDMLARPIPPVPPLNRIVEAPVFAPNGELQTEPGYHEASRTYYAPAKGFELPPVPDDPTEDELKAAIDLVIFDLLYDFPFVANADLAHAIALFILPFVRDMIDGPTPGHLAESPTPGSGKGLLIDALLIAFAGRNIPTVTEARDDDEWRKRLTAQLREAHSVILIDNIVRPLDSGVLASALTSLIWSDRELGKNVTIRVPVRCVWTATGNNVVLSTELARRFIRIRIDPKQDRPFLRDDFKHPHLRVWVEENRARLVHAALTIVRFWQSKGCPLFSGKPLGSYERWSAIVGGILQTAGIKGFLDNAIEFYEAADSQGSVWRAFLEVWWERFQSQPIKASDLFPLVNEVEGFDLGRGAEHSQKIVFGKKLGAQRDRVIGEFRVLKGGNEKRAVLWRLVKAQKRESVVSVGEYDEYSSSLAPDDFNDLFSHHNINRGEGSRNIPQHSPTLTNTTSAEIGVGDCVNCLSVDGCVVNATPLVVVDVRAHEDGQLYCFFAGQSSAWPISRCELVKASEFEVEL